MTPNPRQQALLAEVTAHGSRSVEELARALDVTPQTVRRDVGQLAQAGLLARFHGGVRTPESTIENIAYAHFDFDTMSKLVLARNWAKLTPEQQTQFVAEFRQHLSVTYGKNVDNYKNETIDILGDREEARGDWTVKTRIDRGGGSNDISVDYRLRKTGDQWQIIDVTIEGVSLIANFRSQFQDILSHDSADKMLALLREKNASGESILPKENGRTGG